LPNRAASARASTARSRSSSARWSLHGAPIYVRHEVVHNKFVVDDLRKKGAVFVEDLDTVPKRQHA
jgi:4-hydroxy-3-methylbut-2-enyl diphosphate reductase IspH